MKRFVYKTLIYRRYKLMVAFIANLVYGFPSEGIKCIGVTGTDGKTTTNELIYHIMKKAGKRVGLMTTISIDIGNGKQENRTKMTSLTHFEFNRLMKEAQKNGLEYMVVEPSSHAIYQHRIRPAKFIAVGITNLTHEHLDFHITMEHYFKTKAEIFHKNLYKTAFGIVPLRFPYNDELKRLAKLEDIFEFDKDKNTNIYCENIFEHPELETTLVFNFGEVEEIEKLRVKTKLIGTFNLDNVMIATGICRKLGIHLNDIQKGVESFSNPPGRQDVIKTDNNITFIIDFALTPHALEVFYSSIKRLPYKRQIAIFGATGDRDKTKRPTMGKIATENNDRVIITEDENYNEKGEDIIKDIQAGTGNNENYEVVQDRRMAIRKAIEIAKPGDVVLITGMGNFNTRAMGDKKIPWNDEKVLLEELQ